KYYIAVFVMESQETDADNAAIIASISQIVYDTLNSDIQ
ncbi:class A beta-lactamase, partial [Bacteroides intestinalis]|nr:class A beta-lactamase [Bacteroides intestinalis]